MKLANANPFEEIRQKRDELQRVLSEKGERALKRAVSDAFADCPQLKRLMWTQYTPYFNDGEACVFGVGDVHADFGPEHGLPYGEYDEDGEDGIYSFWDVSFQFPDSITSGRETLQQLNRDLQENEDLLESVFGDHVKITATRDEITVEEYDHD